MEQHAEHAEITIDSVAYGGSGVGRRNGKAVFVPFTAPGDTVAVRITKVSKRFEEGEILEILDPSPDRIDPPCPFFGSCGGCQIQHLNYGAQLREKREMVLSAIRKTCGIVPDVGPTVPSPEPLGYRNRGRLHYRKEASGARLGYFGARSHELIAIDSCSILQPSLSSLIPEMSRSFPYPDAPEEGDIDLFFDSAGAPASGMAGTTRRTAGFTQVNEAVNKILRQTLFDHVSRLGLPGSLEILDLYCGDGNLSLPLAPLARRIEGSDLEGHSVAAAAKRAEEDGIFHSRYVREHARRTAERVGDEGRKVDVLVLDPPRSGCADCLEEISAVNARRIFYVSCVPPILARDIKGFMEHGYILSEVLPLDMFPQTFHIESLATLVLR